MSCCANNSSDDETNEGGPRKRNENENFPFFISTLESAKKISYVRQLERRYESLQFAYFNLSGELARVQFYLKQILKAESCDRDKIIDEIKCQVYQKPDCNATPTLEEQNVEMGSPQGKHNLLIASLIQQIGSFQKASEKLKENDETEQTTNQLEKPRTTKCSLFCCMKAASTDTLEDTPVKTEVTQKTPPKSDKTKGNPKNKTSFVNPTNPSSNKAQATNLPQRKTGGLSMETLSSGQSLISTRSASFKELRDLYQNNNK